MSRLSRHLGLGEEVEIGGEKFLIRPLDVESLPDLYAIYGAAMKGGDDPAHMMAAIDPVALKRLIKRTLELSFPEETPKVRDEFGMKYSLQIFEAIMRVNTSGVETSDAKAKFLKRQRERNQVSEQPNNGEGSTVQ